MPSQSQSRARTQATHKSAHSPRQRRPQDQHQIPTSALPSADCNTSGGNAFRFKDPSTASLWPRRALCAALPLALAGFAWTSANATPLRRWIGLAMAVGYTGRTAFNLCFTMLRVVEWDEAISVSAFLFLVLSSFGYGASTCASFTSPQLTPTDTPTDMPVAHALLAGGMYLFGSVLETTAELQRHVWKQRASNKGKCYTQGLFGYATHINYTGEVILFCGWALASGRWFNGWVPVSMLAGFVFWHIPHLDKYLLTRYGEQFRRYAHSTKKLIPWIY